MGELVVSPAGVSVKSARRALQILELLTRREQPLSFTEIAADLGFPKSSLHGLLRTLCETGWASFDPAGHTYALGLRTLEAGNAYTRALTLPQRALPVMTTLRDTLTETVQLAVRDGRFNVYVAKVDGNHALTLASEVGRRLPAHATGLGKVLLAALPAPDVAALLRGVRLERFTERTHADLPDLARELARVRARGCAFDQEEYTRGVRCVAVPVRDHTGGVVAALSVSVPTIRFPASRRKAIVAALRAGAAELSAALGAPGPAARAPHRTATARGGR